ncbi:hypothetical protein OOT46_00090 [Aquabacterium sp. A7-Y]|uniref:hypothetical protein n=1 Tax=Aquabacterium sp. A7-Y TaxID=1349605 RepID=UPI00223CB0A3|nr:hypothetical protein [Aquabacterium sp. A7-Y]MCW7536253.1 hypothetical protein [Aquabacterium sp. A7-Y]
MTWDAQVWNFACTLFKRSTPTLIAALPCDQRVLLSALVEAHVVEARPDNNPYVLCPECHQQHGHVVDLGGSGGTAVGCDCPDCGIVTVTPDYRLTVELDTRWLAAQLRLALGISGNDGPVELAEGVWRLGSLRHEPVLLARCVSRLWARSALLGRMRSSTTGRALALTPQTSLPLPAEPFEEGIMWMPLQRCFVLNGSRLSCIEPPPSPRAELARAAQRPVEAVHGPFSDDFEWVFLKDYPHNPIRLTRAQAAVFRALWSFNGEPRKGEVVMARAGLKGNKPAEVFKVKTENKGKPEYEAPRYAYSRLVEVNAREGTYALKL